MIVELENLEVRQIIKMKDKILRKMAGFTLVELLIVIALISILAVAVLATINPIEQSNKAKDATVQNDAAEVMNAYERYYANKQSYPWMNQADALSVEDSVILGSDDVGFAICGLGAGVTGVTADAAGVCATATTSTFGALIESDELKPSFAGKAEFKSVAVNPENSLWLYKAAGSGGSIYVCYIPKAKSNRQQTSKLYCLYSDGTAKDGTFDRCQAGTVCNGRTCTAKAVTALDWDDAAFTGLVGMYMCVPE